MEDIKILSFDGDALNQRVVDLQNKIKNKDIELDQLQNLIDDQTDHNMRETLIISGIEGHDKTWDETRDLLSRKLEEVSENTINKDTISSAIIRAYRGGKDRKAIFVKFNNSYMVNKIKSLNFKRKGVYISQMRSPFVTARIKKAPILRKSLKGGDGKNWLMYVNDKAELMIKRPGEFKYKVYKSF